jgi:starch phosphorylase
LNAEALKLAIAYKLMFIFGKDPSLANKHEWLNATLFAIRDRLVERWLRAHRARVSQEVRQVYYLSMEFLIGRTLSNALLSLGIYDDVKTALAEMGLDLDALIDEENDPVWAMEVSVASQLVFLILWPRWPTGTRLRYPLRLRNVQAKYLNGCQMKSPDYWLEYGDPWNLNAIRRGIPFVSAGEFNRRVNIRAGWKPKKLSRSLSIR